MNRSSHSSHPTLPCLTPTLQAAYDAARARMDRAHARFRPGKPAFLTPSELAACERPTIPCPPPESTNEQ